MKKNDVIIIIAGLVLAVIVYGGLQISQQLNTADQMAVEVYIDGELERTIPIEGYGVYTYDTELGHNVFEINEEGARMIEADCPTLSCTRQAAINHVGENIVCLPHRFHLVVVGDEEVEVDAISQ